MKYFILFVEKIMNLREVYIFYPMRGCGRIRQKRIGFCLIYYIHISRKSKEMVDSDAGFLSYHDYIHADNLVVKS